MECADRYLATTVYSLGGGAHMVLSLYNGKRLLFSHRYGNYIWGVARAYFIEPVLSSAKRDGVVDIPRVYYGAGT